MELQNRPRLTASFRQIYSLAMQHRLQPIRMAKLEADFAEVGHVDAGLLDSFGSADGVVFLVQKDHDQGVDFRDALRLDPFFKFIHLEFGPRIIPKCFTRRPIFCFESCLHKVMVKPSQILACSEF